MKKMLRVKKRKFKTGKSSLDSAPKDIYCC